MLAAALLLAFFAPAVPADVARTYTPKLEKNLMENIAPFWFEKSIDKTNGGFIINHDAKGVANSSGSKGIVTQSRQVWFFSRMARQGIKPKESLAAASHGFQFLHQKMLDKKHGGYFWEVDAAGAKALKPKKHLYGQSFALYALSEYYLASKDKAALQAADELFRLMESKAHDAEFGGYREYFNEDWTDPPADENGYLSAPPALKLMNTHLHLMEAMTAYYEASQAPLARERLSELLGIQTSAVLRKKLGACTDRYSRNWTPQLEGNGAIVSYGHDLENVWLIADACRALKISPAPYVDLFRTLWDYSLQYGYDEKNGGFYDSGKFNQPASGHDKTWWVQAEAIVSALYMHKLTGEQKYLDNFVETYDFIDRYQTDWSTGEWHQLVSESNVGRGGKASIWKAGYHNGRAMLESLVLLKQLR